MKRIGSPFNKKQSGFSIVELMIAGLLGLFLIAGVIQLFLGSNRSYTMQEQLATIQEDGRFALMFLEKQVEMAGWKDESNNDAVAFALDLDNSSDNTNDTLTISSVRAINGVDNRDCNGSVVADGVVKNSFFVEDNELKCRGVGGITQPLISGVSSFQVLYGVETDLICPDGIVDRYMTRTEVNAASISSDNILSVRMGLLLASSRNVLPTARDESFQVLDQVSEFSDQILRRLFQQTVFMPNAAFKLLSNTNAAIVCKSGF